MNIPDPLEIMESVAEDWACDNIKGDYFICSCGEKSKLSQGHMISSNPYSPPVCGKCLDKFIDESKNG